MVLEFTTEAILGALAIFALRVCDMSLDTFRGLFVVRGKKKLSWELVFFQSVDTSAGDRQCCENLANN
jgi:hypothetical protein